MPSLDSYSETCLEGILNLLWAQWSALGVAGYAQADHSRVVDPEALLALTMSMGRYDARIFDAAIEWSQAHTAFVNVQRLRGIVTQHRFEGVQALSATLETATFKGVKPTPPQMPAKPEPFFLLRDGRPMPVRRPYDVAFQHYGLLRAPFASREVTRSFSAERAACLLLRLRALFGVSARSEIIAYLLTHTTGQSHEIARHTGYYQKTVYDLLVGMEHSGFVRSVRGGRERHFRLVSTELRKAFAGDASVEWPDWALIYREIEKYWFALNASTRAKRNLTPDGVRSLDHVFVENLVLVKGVPILSAPRDLADAKTSPLLTLLSFLTDDSTKQKSGPHTSADPGKADRVAEP